MSRRVFLLGIGIALVALALAFTDWALSLRPGVTEANVKRIRPGMTLKEVESILGGLPSPSPHPALCTSPASRACSTWLPSRTSADGFPGGGIV
jgi:hypothetical protein